MLQSDTTSQQQCTKSLLLYSCLPVPVVSVVVNPIMDPLHLSSFSLAAFKDFVCLRLFNSLIMPQKGTRSLSHLEFTELLIYVMFFHSISLGIFQPLFFQIFSASFSPLLWGSHYTFDGTLQVSGSVHFVKIFILSINIILAQSV